MESWIKSSPTVVDGRLYLATDMFDSGIYAIATDHGESSVDSAALAGTAGGHDRDVAPVGKGGGSEPTDTTVYDPASTSPAGGGGADDTDTEVSDADDTGSDADGTDTKVFDAADADGGDGDGDTEVFVAEDGDPAGPAGASDGSHTPRECPSCGRDLGALPDPNFCPECAYDL